MLREISSAQRIVAPKCVEAGWDVTWIAPPNQQLLLRYLGEISRALPHTIRESLRTSIEGFAPIILDARGMGIHDVSVDGVTQRRVVVNITDTNGDVAKLRALLAQPLEDLGFQPQTSEFDLHVVVGKVSGDGSQALETLLEEMLEKDFGNSSVQELILYRSDAHAIKGEFLRLWHLPFLRSTGDLSASRGLEDEERSSDDQRSSDEEDKGELVETVSDLTPDKGPDEANLEPEQSTES